MASDERVLEQQLEYYRARAGEYDQWFLRLGRYDRGEEHRAAWFAELDSIRLAVAESIRDCKVLELACGTGLWTEQLAWQNPEVLAVDASAEVIAINRTRGAGPHVRFELADLFAWRPRELFDAVFFAFWLSHVPPNRFDDFWSLVRSSLKPGGCVFFVDSLLEQTSTATDHELLSRSGVVRRKLNDGREFDIVKVFYEPAELEKKLEPLGWHGWIRSSGKFFLFGLVTR